MTQLGSDILSDALGFMRVSGNLLLAETYTPPWGIAMPDQEEMAALLEAEPGTQVVAFHFVHHGCFKLHGVNGDSSDVHAGTLVICFGGVAHHLSQGVQPRLVPLHSLLDGKKGRFYSLNSTRADSTALVCGAFLLRDTHLNPLFAALPPFLQVCTSDANHASMSSTLTDMLIREVCQPSHGTNYAIHRLLELLCVEAIRSYMATVDARMGGWFAGVKDPLMGQALSQFHRNPGEAWSVGKLAQVANLSSSRFAARFVAAFNESCMSYVTRWRINLARHLLNSTNLTVEEIAFSVGYQNLSAFSRTFKQHIGISPVAWRAQQKHPGATITTR
jgi:AraC-like DNA-binding protein